MIKKLIVVAAASFICGFVYTRYAFSSEIVVGKKKERAVCETLWSEPVIIRCFSAQHICTYYTETGQLECVER